MTTCIERIQPLIDQAVAALIKAKPTLFNCYKVEIRAITDTAITLKFYLGQPTNARTFGIGTRLGRLHLPDEENLQRQIKKEDWPNNLKPEAKLKVLKAITTAIWEIYKDARVNLLH